MKPEEYKRFIQKKQAWIKNVMRVYGYTEEQAQSAYERIKPFDVDILEKIYTGRDLTIGK